MTPDGSLHQNLELKARLANPTVVAPALLALGAQSGGRLDQVDTYFVVPAGRLKLREIAGAEAQLIAYDRPETQAHRVSQFRVSRVVDPAGMRQVLSTSLGVLGTVSKRRELYLWKDSRIHLDEVEGLGSFIEFEVGSRGDAWDDRERMKVLMETFQLGPADALRASYADLLGFTT